MPVYHLTLHAYRTWSVGNKRGYVKRGEGIKPPQPKLAKYHDRIAKQPVANFDHKFQNALINFSHEICESFDWKLHAVGTETAHLHLVFSSTQFIDPDHAAARLKNLLSLKMNRLFETPGKRWWVRGDSHRRVKNRAHFNHLINQYLPDHTGVFWKDGQPLPEFPQL